MSNEFVEIVGWVVVGVFIIVCVALLYTIPIYFLWNWLMPELFNLKKITLWQSLGIVLLSSLLFGRPGRREKE